MTSSNETFRKSRTFTWIAAVAALATVALLSFLLWKVNELEDDYGAIRDDRVRLEAALQVVRQEVEALADRRHILRAELEELEGYVDDARGARDELDHLRSLVNEAREQLSQLRSEQQVVQDSLTTLDLVRTELDSARDTLRQRVTERESLRKEIEAIQERRDNLDHFSREAEKKRDELVSEVDRLSTRRGQLHTELLDLQMNVERLDALRQDIADARLELIEVRGKVDAAEVRHTQIEEKYADIKADTQNARGALGEVNAELEVLTTRRAAMEEEVDSLTMRRDSLQSSLAVLEGRLQEEENLHGRLEVKRQQLVEAESRLYLLRGEVAAEQEQLDGLSNTRLATEAQVAEREARLNALVETLSQIDSRRIEAMTQLQHTEAGIIAAHDREVAIQAEVLSLSTERDELQQSIENARVVRAAIEGKTSQRTEELAFLQDRIKEEEERLARLGVQATTLREDIPVLESHRNEIDAQRLAAREDLGRAETDLSVARATVAETRATVERLEGQRDDLSSEVVDLQVQSEALQEMIKEAERQAALSRASLDALDQEIQERHRTLDSLQHDAASSNSQPSAAETSVSQAVDGDTQPVTGSLPTDERVSD